MLASILVVADKPTEALDPTSRINFAELYTVQYNCKVMPFGHVHEKFHARFDRLRHHVIQQVFPAPLHKIQLPLWYSETHLPGARTPVQDLRPDATHSESGNGLAAFQDIAASTRQQRAGSVTVRAVRSSSAAKGKQRAAETTAGSVTDEASLQADSQGGWAGNLRHHQPSLSSPRTRGASRSRGRRQSIAQTAKRSEEDSAQADAGTIRDHQAGTSCDP